MFMLLTIVPAIQFEDVYHSQCSVGFNQRAVKKGDIYLGQKVFEDKKPAIFQRPAFHSQSQL